MNETLDEILKEQIKQINQEINNLSYNEIDKLRKLEIKKDILEETLKVQQEIVEKRKSRKNY